ncbi:MAG: hypothetical protein ACTSU4_07990 [Promethearchaeota archaeon]
MKDSTEHLEKENLIKMLEKLALKIEQMNSEISQLKHKLDKLNKINRSFGLKSLRNSEPLEFAKEIQGIASPSKKYFLSIRAITEMWKGRKNDILIIIRQHDLEQKQDLKALGIRIPITDISSFRTLTREIASLLYIACELKGIDTTLIFREILEDIYKNRESMLNEIKRKMDLKI